MYSINAYTLALDANQFLYATIKKGLTSVYARKPLILLVGTVRFELTTSTVSG